MKSKDVRERMQRALAREVGYVRKSHAGRLRIALVFPNTYYVGMSNLGLQTVYRLFNEVEHVVCERAFLPPKQELQGMLTRGTRLLSMESQTPLGDFDAIAFSVSFEWDYTNVLTVLRLAGLPLYASERSGGHPLVVIGGAVTFVNPEPLAPFADVVAAGEGEVLVPALVEALDAKGDRDTILRRLVGQQGFYIPSFYEPRYSADGRLEGLDALPGTGAPPVVHKAALRSTDAVDPPSTSIYTPDTEFGARFLVEVVRGCANLCRFCWAGYNYLPVRAFPASRVLELAEAARPFANRVGLVSIALCDHPAIEEILRRLVDLGYSISPASLRLDDLTPAIVSLLHESGERSITIAPETGSDRLRRVINKTVTNDEIVEKSDLIFASGIENLKLYYMIGLPTEADDDLVAIRDLTLAVRERMLDHGRPRGRLGRVVASVNPMIPKPGTAFQWVPMQSPAAIERASRRLRGLVAGIDNVYFNIKSERHAYYQALLSLGDRRVAPAVEAAERNGHNWRAAVAEVGLDADAFVYRDRSHDQYLPWSIIDGGVKESFFRAEFDKALHGEWTLPPKRARENERFIPALE